LHRFPLVRLSSVIVAIPLLVACLHAADNRDPVAHACCSAPRSPGAQDLDGNGRPDRWQQHGVEHSIEQRDSDGDGRADVTVEYGPRAGHTRIAEDRDGDGQAESVAEFRAGVRVMEQRDSNGDGAPDRWVRKLADGTERHAIDRDHDGFADAVLLYRAGQLVEQRFDRDGDGRFETVGPAPSSGSPQP
jgi:hypothetical protein